jgi:uncharacterized protein YbjT (DUF2867 family)
MLQPLILVVGATGQLGAVVVRKLCARGLRVRALVRTDSRAAHLSQLAVELVYGDLLDPASLLKACNGVDYVIATANAAVPRKPSERFENVDGKGYRDLIDATRQCGVRQFVYTSVAAIPGEGGIPLISTKRATERYLQTSGLVFTIVRASSFMDFAFAMMGSELPLRGAETPTIERPFWFTRSFFSKVKNRIANGSALVAGSGTTRHSFIAINDVAEYLVRVLGSPVARNRTFEAGGPEPLSSRDIVKLYEDLLHKKLRISATPAPVFRLAGAILRPLSPAASNIMALNYLMATENGIVSSASETAAELGIQLTTAEQFLRRKFQQQMEEDD